MLEVLHNDRIIEVPRPDSPGVASATLLEALAAEPHLTLFAPCGGRGKCGKCRVRIADPAGGPAPSQADRRFLSPEEIADGIRLACTCPAAKVKRVEILTEQTRATVKSELPAFTEAATPPPFVTRAGLLAAAIDIGTTTVAAFLLDAAAGTPLAVHSRMNRQSVYGADVLSRISYAEDGGLRRLSLVIRAQLQAMLEELCAEAGRKPEEIGTVSVAGNTTMLHLLAAEDPAGIGRAPFVPGFTERREYAGSELDLELAPAARVVLLPSVSAYVGADIVCDAVAAALDREERTTLLVDVGTNGELVLRHGGKQWACSTAAGPAFEGATIEAGVGGTDGAIRSFRREGAAFSFETIGGAEPVGVCGAGLLEVTAALLDDGVVEPTGRMLAAGELAAGEASGGARNAGRATGESVGGDGAGADAGTHTAREDIARAYEGRLCTGPRNEPAFVLAGPYLLTQKDVREVQLAKAAIAAGIDTLLREAGIAAAELDRVVMTGGFGQHLSVESAVRIGLLPALDPLRFETVENGAGIGALLALREEDALERMERFREDVSYIELSGHEFFGERYIEHMTFPESSGNAFTGGA